MIIYNKTNGFIMNQIPDNQDISLFYYHFPQEFKDNLEVLYDYLEPNELSNYRVLDGVLVELSEVETQDIEEHRRILSEEERFEIQMLKKLKPSYEEIQKAENTIEILTLLSEVL